MPDRRPALLSMLLKTIEDVDESKIGASFKNGVLTVTMPKSTKAQ